MDIRFEDSGVTVDAFRATMPMQYGGELIKTGQWVLTSRLGYKVMCHEEFAQRYGKQLEGMGVLIPSLGFGTPDDPRNSVVIGGNGA